MSRISNSLVLVLSNWTEKTETICEHRGKVNAKGLLGPHSAFRLRGTSCEATLRAPRTYDFFFNSFFRVLSAADSVLVSFFDLTFVRFSFTAGLLSPPHVTFR